MAGRQLFGKLREIHITNPPRNLFEEMWPALKAHHDTPTPGGLSPHQILFGRDPLGQGLPLSGDGMAMDAKEFFAQQEATARDIRQQLEREHAERQKSALSSTAQTFRVRDPVWMIRPCPMGTDRTKTWFTPGEVVCRVGEDTYRIKVGHGQFRERHESQLCVQEPDLRDQHVSLDYAAHEADSDNDYAEQGTMPSRRSLPSVRTPRHPEAWSSRFVGEALGRPTTPGNPSPRSCRGLTPPSWTTSASTRPSSMTRTWQHSQRRLQPEAPDHRPELSPDEHHWSFQCDFGIHAP